jgi:2-polyprenyl-3-methyl-5-hydroxy-6-metoxy-1,4-benzoquinol methylase
MESIESKSSRIRFGDNIEIDGSYQYRALKKGSPIQRYWHVLKFVQIELYSKPTAQDVVIDIGCGSGVIADYLSNHARRVIGIDANPRAIEFARNTFQRPNVEYREAFVEDIDFEPASIDRIYCLELLEHIYKDQAEALLQRCWKMLKPSGSMLITTPNYRGFWPFVEFLIDSLNLAPRMGDDQHVTHYNRFRLRELLTSIGFSVRTLRTFSTFAPFFAHFPRLANWIEILERRINLPFGNILIAVAYKKDKN